MASNNSVRLPTTLEQFKAIFPGMDLKRILENSQNPEKNFSLRQTLVWKYAGGALLAGRPLNSAMIFMTGIPETGKSTTINVLLGDPDLFGHSPEDVFLIEGELTFSGGNLPVTANLNFADVSRTFDNYRNFVEGRVELNSRNELATLSEVNFELSEATTTFPNMVFFTIRATDYLRMSGPEFFSSFRDSLEVLLRAPLIDGQRPNLIVVVTHALSLAPKKERFIEELASLTEQIRGIVFRVFRIRDVDVVPIENNGRDLEMEKVGEFYKFPDGQLSHSNLIDAMLRRFDGNRDLIARSLLGLQFSRNEPEN